MGRPLLGALIVALAAASAGCAESHDVDSPGVAAAGTFAGLVDIGGGRKLFLNCQGTGSPTVFIIPGKGSYAEAWNYVVPPDDPIRSAPYDLITQATLEPSPDAVQPTVARSTHVCAYDRPNTRPDGADLSTPVPQPHTVAQDVEDLVKLLPAANPAGPFVVVAHSYGGLVADLLARTHPGLVSDLVMVDPVSEFLPAVGTPEQNAAFDKDGPVPPWPDGEGILPDDAFARIRAAPPLPKVPAVMLSSDKFQPSTNLTPDNYTLAQIQQANSTLATELGTTNVTNTDSGHNVMLYQPRLVADEIIELTRRVMR